MSSGDQEETRHFVAELEKKLRYSVTWVTEGLEGCCQVTEVVVMGGH